MIFKNRLGGNMKYYGLFIELKTPEITYAGIRPAYADSNILQRKGTVSKDQKDWINYLNKESYLAKVCYGSNEAIDLIKWYMQ